MSDNIVINDASLRQSTCDTMVISMSPEQSRMARAALGWSLTKLAAKAGIGRATVARFELGESVQNENVASIARSFEDAGLKIIAAGEVSESAGEGVRFQTVHPD
ncbi:helix-turn-helix transcriptional regulator [Sphingobium sp. SA2]|uniref:helix-turn-helix domain-containing protein n=1 Tax=Sphingobium sp. SA2 TaxID=1524832 RepID=UPI0028C09963|nr:helix-turn-helix transcriptional regulator [Sphingobium sp. SA2]MDT7536162.1 helix-turn-helix transcriptional regulator [Sphingobium sp. SA2]